MEERLEIEQIKSVRVNQRRQTAKSARYIYIYFITS